MQRNELDAKKRAECKETSWMQRNELDAKESAFWVDQQGAQNQPEPEPKKPRAKGAASWTVSTAC